MTHKSTALKSVTQSETTRSERHLHSQQTTFTAEADLSQSTETENEQPLLSVKKMIYSDLVTAVKELQKGHRDQRHSVSQQQKISINDADTLYDIVSVKQLQHWAEVESEQFLNILNKLQEQRDLEISVSEDVKNIMTEQDYLSDNRDILTDLLTEKRAHVTSLNTNFITLNIKYQLLKEYQQTDCERTLLFNVSMHSVNEGQHSQKLSDSSLLNDSSEPTWNNWLEKIHIKLFINHAHFSEETDWMRYVLSQLSEKITQHTESHSLYESSVIDLYQTADKVLKNLKDIYEDSDKSRNFHWAYIELV